MPKMKLPGRRSTALKLRASHVDFWFGSRQVLFDVSLDIYENEIVALIGPPGAGHTTFLRCLNRINEVVGPSHLEGLIELDGVNIYDRTSGTPLYRRKFAVVPQGPNLAPGSIYENLVSGAAAIRPSMAESERRAIAERALRSVGLWDVYGERMDEPCEIMRMGDQQLLCVARALAMEPEVLLMDKPCNELGPNATERLEALLRELADDYTILLVTPDLAQARRIAHRVAFFRDGRILESGETETVFAAPEHPETRAFLAQRLR